MCGNHREIREPPRVTPGGARVLAYPGLLSETPAGFLSGPAEYTCTIAPARALAAETLTLRRTLSNLADQAYALIPTAIPGQNFLDHVSRHGGA